MKATATAIAGAALVAAALALPAHASGRDDLVFTDFIDKCDTDKDGMVSKSEAMKMIEKAFDKADAGKRGKLDKKQVEFFLKELMKSGA